MTRAVDEPTAGSGHWDSIQFDHYDPRVSYAPHDLWRRLRNGCPVIHSERHGGFWLATRYDDVKTILSDWDVFSAGVGGTVLPAMPMAMLPGQSDPPLHRDYRTLLNTPLAPQVVKEHEGWIRDLARDWLRPLAERERFDACVDYAEPFAKRMAMRVIGFPIEDLDSLDHWTEVLAVGERSDDEAAEVGAQFFGYLARTLEASGAETPREDIISAIAHGEVEGRPLRPEEKQSLLLQITFGGLHTTGAVIAGSLLWLAGHPEDRARIRERPELMRTATEEFLRHVVPVPYSIRTTTSETELSGCPIGAGERVMFGLGPANYDPEVFSEPDDVDLERFPNRHLTFGAGPHRCPGSHLGKLGVRIGIEEFLAAFPDFSVADYYGLRYSRGEGRALTALPIAVPTR